MPKPNLSHHHQTLLEDIIAIADGMDVLNRSSSEFEFAYQNLDCTIHKLDVWGAIDSPIPHLAQHFDSSDHKQCRNVALEIMKNQ